MATQSHRESATGHEGWIRYREGFGTEGEGESHRASAAGHEGWIRYREREGERERERRRETSACSLTVPFVLYERSLHASCTVLTQFLVMHTLYVLNLPFRIAIHR